MSEPFPDLSALKAADSAAWDEAFRYLWPVALCGAHNPEACLADEDAEDVADEAIQALISQIESVPSVGELKALVFKIASRRAISAARRKSAIKRCFTESYVSEVRANSVPMNTVSPEVERRELADLLAQALQGLDDDTREFLKEKIELNLTYKEISARHGIPLGTVCTKVARGLKKVHAELQHSPALMKELEAYLR
jgi:RNA polymerase sigma-70 factor (ECF subfamily)